ncbi:MAG: MFS transporter [Chloroflexi bacterium]|nr:MFS transporter [Chloroflexota bacterium]
MMADPATSRGGPLRAFSHTGFRLFWGASFLSMSSFFMVSVARGWLILELTDSAFMVTAVQAVSMLPILFALIGGVIADRMNKRVILIASDGASMVFVFVLAVLVAMDVVEAWQVFVLALVSGIAFALALPSRIALVGDLVGEADLPSGAALYISIFSTALLVGPGIGGVLIDSLGMGTALFIGALMVVPALALFALLLGIRIPRPATAAETPPSKRSVISDIAEGVRYATKDHVLRVMLVLGIATSLLAQPYQSILPVFARDVLDRGADGLGMLVAAGGMGAIPGSVTVAFLNSPRQLRSLIVVGGIGLGIAIILFSLSTVFLVSVALSFSLGYLFQIVITSSFTVIQILTPAHLRGRVVSLRLVGHGVAPLGMLLLGIGAEYTSPVQATATMGVMALVAMTVIALAMPNLRRAQPARTEGYPVAATAEVAQREGSEVSGPD